VRMEGSLFLPATLDVGAYLHEEVLAQQGTVGAAYELHSIILHDTKEGYCTMVRTINGAGMAQWWRATSDEVNSIRLEDVQAANTSQRVHSAVYTRVGHVRGDGMTAYSSEVPAYCEDNQRDLAICRGAEKDLQEKMGSLLEDLAEARSEAAFFRAESKAVKAQLIGSLDSIKWMTEQLAQRSHTLLEAVPVLMGVSSLNRACDSNSRASWERETPPPAGHCTGPAGGEGGSRGPSPPEAEGASSRVDKTAMDAAQELKGLLGQCMRHSPGWWTYKVCSQDSIAQSHGTDEFSLGTFKSAATRADGDSLTYEEVFENGSACDMPGAGQYRTAVVRWQCGTWVWQGASEPGRYRNRRGGS